MEELNATNVPAVINVKTLEDPGYLIFGTKNGNVKKTEISKYKNIRSTGIRALILNDGDELIAVEKSDGNQSVILGASNGKAVRFDEVEVRPTNRSAAGVKAIKLEEGERTVGMAVVPNDEAEIIGHRRGKKLYMSISYFCIKGVRSGLSPLCMSGLLIVHMNS